MRLFLRHTIILVSCSIFMLSCTDTPAVSQTEYSEPQYSSDATRDIVLKMVDAHGGIDRWRNAPTISYDNVFFNPFATEGPNAYPWWVSHEVFDQETRRAYHDWTMDAAELSFDGNEVWTLNWSNGNPPKFMTMFFYYFVNLPWLTQDANVRLGEVERDTLAGSGTDVQYYTVEMTFSETPTVGKSDRDKFKLYIDPETYLLQGYEYWIGYGPMLSAMGVPAGEIFGPMLRHHDKFATVDGLVFPARFHTMAPDGSATYGYHIILNHRLDEPFDEGRMVKSAGAVIADSP